MKQISDELYCEIDALLYIARHAASKLAVEYKRGSISPRSEWDSLVESKDRFMEATMKLRGIEPIQP